MWPNGKCKQLSTHGAIKEWVQNQWEANMSSVTNGLEKCPIIWNYIRDTEKSS